jgi:hypothetical protein
MEDLMRKLATLVAVVVIITSSASISLATLISSFEGTGFSEVSTANNSYAFSTSTGVTDATQSYAITTINSLGWDWLGQIWDAPGTPGQSLGQIMKANSVLKFDITAPGPGDWMQMFVNIQGDGLGWSGSPGLAGAYIGADKQTVSWDYSSLMGSVPANPSWFQIHFTWQGAPGQTIYIDNLRAVPEPATIVLLSVAGLMGLLYWRKR